MRIFKATADHNINCISHEIHIITITQHNIISSLTPVLFGQGLNRERVARLISLYAKHTHRLERTKT